MFRANKAVEHAGSHVALVRWFYRPQDVAVGGATEVRKNELFMSFHEDFVPLESIDVTARPVIKHAHSDVQHKRESEKPTSSDLYTYSRLWDQRLQRMHTIDAPLK